MNKGRSKDLIARRDAKLAERWHYWTEVKRRRIDDVMQILSTEEFFLSQQRIMVIIKEQSELLDKLNNKTQPIKQLNLFENEKN